MASKSGFQCDPEMSLAGARLLARRCPACRRRESDLGFCMEREKARVDTGFVAGSVTSARGSASSSRNCETSSTVAAALADQFVVVMKLL